jgi:uncharacterized repeat protein (TIGR02543 family)
MRKRGIGKRLLACLLAVAMVVTSLMAGTGGEAEVTTGATEDGFVVTFNSSGGSNVLGKTLTSGSVIGELPSPSRKGYIFNGWYIDGRKIGENYVIESNIVLIAKWRAKTKITGLKKLRKGVTAGSKLSDEIEIEFPYGRRLSLYQYSKKTKKYIKVKSYRLSGGEKTDRIKIRYPKSFWRTKRETFSLRISENAYATSIQTKIVVKSKRRYQAPKKYLQFSDTRIKYIARNKMSAYGRSLQDRYGNYCSPLMKGVGRDSTKKQLIELFIKRAKQYLGDPYVVFGSRPLGRGVDCSGIVMQAMYSVGFSPKPSSSYRHMFPAYEYESRQMWYNNKIKKIPYSEMKRGDLVFYLGSSGTVNHVAIYLGGGKVIESYAPKVMISGITARGHSKVAGVGRIFV